MNLLKVKQAIIQKILEGGDYVFDCNIYSEDGFVFKYRIDDDGCCLTFHDERLPYLSQYYELVENGCFYSNNLAIKTNKYYNDPLKIWVSANSESVMKLIREFSMHRRERFENLRVLALKQVFIECLDNLFVEIEFLIIKNNWILELKDNRLKQIK